MADKTLRQAFKDIADAIREKGITGTMTPLEMPEKVSEISGGGGMKYGVPIDGLLGDVDQNGLLGRPTETFSFTSNDIRTIGEYALQYKFYGNIGITSLSMPNLTSVDQHGMRNICSGCSNLTSVNLQSLTTIITFGMSYAFSLCTSLTSVDLSSLSSATGTNAISYAFSGCTALQEVKFNNATAIPAISSNTFQNTNSTFKIIVPDALYEQWRTATNWSAYANQIVKVSEYTPAS